MALQLKNYDPAIMQGANIGVSVDLTDITDQNGNEVIEIDGVASAKVDVVWDPPWTPERMSEAARLDLGFF